MPVDSDSPLREEEVVELQRLLATATPEPWGVVLGSGRNLCTGISSMNADGGVTFVADCLTDYAIDSGHAPDDHRPTMNLIVAMRTALPKLLREREALLQRIERLEGRLEQYNLRTT